VLGTPASVIRSRAIASAFHEVIRRECAIPDTVIHVGLNCSALRFPAGPIVYECMDSLLTQLGTRHYERAAMRPAVMHCQTRRIRDALLTSSRVSRPKWSTVVSESYFASYPSDIDYDANVKDSSSIAFVGRLSEEKQPQILVDAVTQLHRRGISCRLTMLGRGPLEDSLRMLIRDRGLEEQIAIGFDARPTTALLNSSIFVTLQKGDNYGSQALLEAMGCGCAIIATEVGETRRIVSSELGLFVPPDGSGLVDALAELILNPALTRSLGERARRTALMEFSADSYVGFLEKLYEKADALAQTR
jgi:glycosyltransferase involved in cell wall biosynthesis